MNSLNVFYARFRSLVLAIWFIAVSAVGIIPPLLKSGFPPNHEDDTYVLRTMVYAKHFRLGDVIPVWSSTDNHGMGSPFPSLYHRLFYLVSGLIYAITSNPKVSISLALIFFTSIGVCFVFLTLRLFHCSPQVSVIGASTLPFLNYSVTNWLVRGAMAEYSAMMLLPVVLYLMKKTWDRESLVETIGFAFGLLFLAHSVIAYFTALVIGVVLLAGCVFRALPWRIFSPKKIGLTALAFCSITWWSLLPLLYFRRTYDVRRLLPDFLNVQFQFHSAREYLWDSTWSWSNAPQLFTLRLDLILILGVFGLMVKRQYSRSHLPLFAILGISLLLQNGRSWRLYNIIPGAEFIQFPWRLSSLSSIAILMLLFIGLKQKKKFAISFAVLTILISGTWQRVNYYSYPDRLDSRNSRQLDDYSLSIFGEYLPKGNSLLTPDPSSSAVFSEWGPKIDELIRVTNSELQCDLQRITPVAETRSVSFSASCIRPSLVILPIFATTAHSVSASRGGVDDRCIITTTNQTLCAVELPQGKTTVTVSTPTFFSVIFQMLHF